MFHLVVEFGRLVKKIRGMPRKAGREPNSGGGDGTPQLLSMGRPRLNAETRCSPTFRIRHRLLTLARSVAIGWATLLAITYLLERPLLIWTAPLVGSSWSPTLQLLLECCALAGTGWVVGRLNPLGAIAGVLVFAATLIPWDFDEVLTLNILGLVRLTEDAFRDPRYFDSLIATAGAQTLLFASLIVGGRLGRPSATTPLSIVGGVSP
jgi:hypothetical protein